MKVLIAIAVLFFIGKMRRHNRALHETEWIRSLEKLDAIMDD